MNNIKMKTLLLAIIMVVSIFTTLSLADMPGNDEASGQSSDIIEQASVIVSGTSGAIEVMLVAHGQSYQGGYEDYQIFINDEEVHNLPKAFVLGKTIGIGLGPLGFSVAGRGLPSGEYQVTVLILGQLMFDGKITVN